jgi:hypothetical protein
MSAEIVNLRRARKEKARAAKAESAAQNRAKFGRTRAEREKEAADKARIARELDGAKLPGPTGTRADHDE